jgi:hypothetical protein
MPPGHLPREHPVIYVADDKPAQHEEQVDRQIALVHRPGVTVGVNRREMPTIVEQNDPEGGDAAQRRQRREGLAKDRSRTRASSPALPAPVWALGGSPYVANRYPLTEGTTDAQPIAFHAGGGYGATVTW